MNDRESMFDVVVAGAGVGGAAFALALASEFDLRVLVLERRPGPGNINRGDSLLPAVTAHLSRWGALERFRAAGARELTTMQVFHYRSGMLLEAPLTRPSDRDPYLVLPHPEIERVLADAARATSRVVIRYRCGVERLLEENGRITGIVVAGAAGEEPVRARLVVGADGSSSAVRAALGIAFRRVPYDHSFFVVDVARPPRYTDAMRIELHPDGGVLVVPGLDRVALAVLVRQCDEEVFRSGSFERRMTAISRRSPLLEECQAFAKGSHLYKLSRAHADRYVARGVALLGDAVHVTNPTAGQGMTMAVEDAAALAKLVGPSLVAGAGLDGALAAYEIERRHANAALLRWSHWMSRFYAMPGLLGDSLRRCVFAFGGSPPGRVVHRRIWSRVATRRAYEQPCC